jgi:Methylase involved in ubiquinone/menaquinone biosynthesis
LPLEKPLKSSDLERITKQTLAHYDQHAADFWEGTKDHDVLQNYQALLEALPGRKGLDILDLGCGPGRDLFYFKNQGHRPVGLEGSPTFCEMARSYSGCEVLEQDFLKLKLRPESFDGIFANASLFHVPSQELPRVLRELWQALKPAGILFSSNPRGNEEGWDGSRYGHFMEWESYRKYLEAAGFEILQHYYRPEGKPRHQQPWLAVVSRKRGNI